MKPREPKTQCDEVVYAMLTKPHITSLVMHNPPFMISNTPDAIFQARQKGYAIETKEEKRGNKFGRTVTIAKWSLKDREAALKKYNSNE